MEHYGWMSLVPAICVILFALFTKRTLEALILGTLLSFIIVHGGGFFYPWMDTMFETLTDYDTMWAIMTCGLFGSLIALFRRSKGTLGFTNLMLKFATTAEKSLIATWILGIIIFVDDYLNILTLGAAMRDITDKHKVPREMLAYIIDSTGAPVCVILPFSTWAVFFAGVFASQPEVAALGVGEGMSLYTKIMPFIFYGWAAIIIVPLVALGIIPKLGPMKKAYQRTEETGKLYSDASDKFNAPELEEFKQGEGKLINFALPMIVLVALTVWTEDLLVGVLAAIAVCLILYLPTKLMTFNEFADDFMKGFCDLIPMLAIIFGALFLQRATSLVGLPAFVIETVKPYLSGEIYPAIAFLVVAGLSFITGSNWGVPAVTVPIIVPLGIALGANPFLVMSTVVSGGTFGSHACFYSDATVLTSSACGIENMDHALTQIPYGAIAAGLAFIAYAITGFIF